MPYQYIRHAWVQKVWSDGVKLNPGKVFLKVDKGREREREGGREREREREREGGRIQLSLRAAKRNLNYVSLAGR